MKSCSYCRIDVGGNLKKCPFCQSNLSGTPDSEYFPKQTTLLIQSFFYKLQMFIVFAIMIITLGEEYLLKLDFFNGVHYSLLTCMWLIVFEFGIMRLFKRGFHASRVLTLFVFIITLLLIVTALEIGMWRLMADWIIPIILMGTMIANFVLAMIDQVSNAMVYLLTNILVGAIPYFVLFAMKMAIPITWIICLMLTIVLFAGAVIFKGRAVFSELQKRLNV